MLRYGMFWHAICCNRTQESCSRRIAMRVCQLAKILLAVSVLAIVFAPDHVLARGRGGGYAGSGSVAVRGYYRSHGTYVAPHYRSAPSRGHAKGRSNYGITAQGRSGWSSQYNQTSRYEGTYETGYPRVERSQSARMTFLLRHGYSKLPSGYEIDHIRPLSQGGSDSPENMQLLTKEQHHLKTARERHKD
jgi:5-methylcytosine-specific restriction endonuclease McrA